MRGLILIAIFGTTLLAGCATPTTGDGRGSAGENFSIPFLYRGLGAGPLPHTGIVYLEKGEEQLIVSRAILRANQSFDLSIVEPPVDLDAIIPESTRWTTDVAPLPRDVIAAYNQGAPSTPLDPTRIYGLGLAGTYRVINEELRFTIESTLYSRGLGSDFTPYESGYSGTFFAELFRKRVKEALSETSTEG